MSSSQTHCTITFEGDEPVSLEVHCHKVLAVSIARNTTNTTNMNPLRLVDYSSSDGETTIN
jgi:hypothetical protein